MLNDLLLSFFFGMPAVVAVAVSFDMKSPLARPVFFWGGLVFTLFAAATLMPMLLCDGTFADSYSACLGGSGPERLFNAAQPLIRAAAVAYILIGPPLACLAYLVEWLHNRRTGAA